MQTTRLGDRVDKVISEQSVSDEFVFTVDGVVDGVFGFVGNVSIVVQQCRSDQSVRFAFLFREGGSLEGVLGLRDDFPAVVEGVTVASERVDDVIDDVHGFPSV